MGRGMAEKSERQVVKVLAWFAKEDARWAERPRAATWNRYPYFRLTRHPQLQPSRPTSKDPRDLEMFKGGREVFRDFLRGYEDKIAQNVEAGRVLDGLSRSQRRQLAALVVDSICELQNYRGFRKFRKTIPIPSEVDRRQRMLASKLSKARNILQDLQQYAKDLNLWLGSEKYAAAAEKCLRTLPDKVEHRKFPPQFLRSDLDPYAPGDPAQSYMALLYWFFRVVCACTGVESEVRVALIRNAFWTEYGVEELWFAPKHYVAKPSGCAAVIEAFRRFLLP